jgi:ribosome-associated toxin RatA of RatAB toxin-antitoxin module
MTQASHSIDVAVTPEEFLSVLRDYARYSEFQPDLRIIRVESSAPGRTQVSYAFDAKVLLLEYTLEHVQAGPLRIEWRLLRGELLKQNAGAWDLLPLQGRGTRVTYTIDLVFAAKVPAGLTRALAEQSLPRMLGKFKARAEGLFPRQIPAP